MNFLTPPYYAVISYQSIFTYSVKQAISLHRQCSTQSICRGWQWKGPSAVTQEPSWKSRWCASRVAIVASFIHLSTHLSIHLFPYFFIHSFIYLFIYSFIYSFIHSFIYSFIYFFIFLFFYLIIDLPYDVFMSIWFSKLILTVPWLITTTLPPSLPTVLLCLDEGSAGL